ncbi:MAG TPA: adenylyl-sulfate kinase [Paludibaculum sp.]|jgi:bifunctional enzyme CysN/CysC
MGAENSGAGLLRFITAGSVDDGKSTLIGRLLHDSDGVYDDQLEWVKKASASAAGGLDLSYFTDGLRAEREQGITIDVAYRHFATKRRRFIIADTPGHEQYTRNMVTGASTADLAVLLIDARQGVLPQSRRHAYLSSLVGIRRVAVAVNKMDLQGYRQDVFEQIRQRFVEWLAPLGFAEPCFIPVSALGGDHIVERSARMEWYTGPTLLEYLETVTIPAPESSGGVRFPVQLVTRAGGDFRGYAGQLAAGTLRVGDALVALPSGLRTEISSIVHCDGEPAEARAPAALTLCLANEIDLSRGDMLADPDQPPAVGRDFRATLVSLATQPLHCDTPYLLKHTTRKVCASLQSIAHRVDIETLQPVPSQELRLNDIAEVVIQTHQPLYFDTYQDNRATGSFILIDMLTNQTIACGMIREDLTASVSQTQRMAKPVHSGLTVWLTGLSGAGKSTISKGVHEVLAARGCQLELLDGDVVRQHLSKGLGFSREDRDENIRRIGFVAGLLTRNHVITIVAAISPYRETRAQVRDSIGSFLEVYVNAPIAVCAERDPKGLYEKARTGQLRGMTGIDDPYEEPLSPDLECRTDLETLPESVAKVVAAIERALEWREA